MERLVMLLTETGDDRPLPVGSIRIDDSMTLSQAREEIFKQLGAHVELPKDFKFMWRGRPFTKAEERRRTVAESLPSLQLRPVKARRRTRRRVPHGLRVLGKYGDSLLDGISEGNEEEWSESDDDTRRYYTEEDGTVSGSVLYRRSGSAVLEEGVVEVIADTLKQMMVQPVVLVN